MASRLQAWPLLWPHVQLGANHSSSLGALPPPAAEEGQGWDLKSLEVSAKTGSRRGGKTKAYRFLEVRATHRRPRPSTVRKPVTKSPATISSRPFQGERKKHLCYNDNIEN